MHKQAGLIVLFLLSILLGDARAQRSAKVSVLWCDPLLNVRQIHSATGIADILDKVQQAGIGAVALGVKSTSGEVIYDSRIAPRLMDWDDYQVPLDFDPVTTFIEEGRKRRLQIYSVFSVFSEGHMISRRGPVYDGHPEWQSQVYVVDEERPTVIPITDWPRETAAFVNPLVSEVRRYESSIIREFLRKYSVDGIILDKIRFSGIESDFSELSRRQFEQSLGPGRTIQWWPEDVYELRLQNDEWEVVPGTYFQEWIAFRANSTRQFLQSLIDEIHGIDAGIPVGTFVGGWYPTYYEYGVNWASETNLPEESWASRDYYNTAVAEMLDYLIVGCYFPRIGIEDAENVGAEWWMSMEGSALLSMEVVNNVCPVYGSVLVELFKNDGGNFKRALKTLIDHTNGLYIYDLSHVERYKYWEEISEVLKGSR